MAEEGSTAVAITPAAPMAGTVTTTSASPKAEATTPKPEGTVLGSGSQKQSQIEYKLALPKDSLLREEAIERTAAYARERGLTNEQASDYLKYESDAIQRFSEFRMAEYEEMKAGWLEEAKKDKELGGGDEAKWKESVALANRVVQKYGSDELRDELDATGFGNHPVLIKFLRKIGLSMKSDQAVTTGAPPSAGRSDPLDKLFPSTAKKGE